MKHYSVLKKELIDGLNINPDGIYVDATLGYAGDSSEILMRMKRGFLFAFDQDEEAIKYSEEKLSKISSNYKIIYSNFANIKEKLLENNIDKVDGIIYDLGVSSPQIDEDYRGFSFHKDAPLDMRMDQTQSLSAYDVVNDYSFDELVRIFRDYGEEKYASSIAKKIVNYRQNKKIETTLELVEVIKSGVPESYKRDKHPARKVFQAIRIEVNNELEVFENAVKQALDLVKVGGRVCVITFHSLEDRICKNIFKEYSSVDKAMQKLPVIPEIYKPKFKVVGMIVPDEEELKENNRSRSAKLRVIERIKEG